MLRQVDWGMTLDGRTLRAIVNSAKSTTDPICIWIANG